MFWLIVLIVSIGSISFYGGYLFHQKRYNYETTINKKITKLAISDSLKTIRINNLADSVYLDRQLVNKQGQKPINHLYPVTKRFNKR